MVNPVAFGFIDGETTDNWTWFMTQLHKAIGDLPVLAISSYACKGLENAVKNVFPQAEHRECFRHLMNNFIKRSGGDVFLRCILQLEHIENQFSIIFTSQSLMLVLKYWFGWKLTIISFG
jgi:transposase-like protein